MSVGYQELPRVTVGYWERVAGRGTRGEAATAPNRDESYGTNGRNGNYGGWGRPLPGPVSYDSCFHMFGAPGYDARISAGNPCPARNGRYSGSSGRKVGQDLWTKVGP